MVVLHPGFTPVRREQIVQVSPSDVETGCLDCLGPHQPITNAEGVVLYICDEQVRQQTLHVGRIEIRAIGYVAGTLAEPPAMQRPNQLRSDVFLACMEAHGLCRPIRLPEPPAPTLDRRSRRLNLP